jgi:hypothetical protein
MQEGTEPNLQNVFDQSLRDRPAFAPGDLPSEWTVGQHKYIRVLAQEDTLDEKLTEFRELGVSVLDYDRRWGFWVFKTMAPQ